MINIWDSTINGYKTAKVLTYKDYRWQEADVSTNQDDNWEVANDDNAIPNISTPRLETYRYKVGYINLLMVGEPNLLEAYHRLYNLFVVQDTVSYVRYKDFKTGEIKEYVHLQDCTVEDYTVPAMYVPLEDLDISTGEWLKVKDAFFEDNYELTFQFYSTELYTLSDKKLLFQNDLILKGGASDLVKTDGLFYYPKVSTNPYDKTGRDFMMNKIESTFREICKKVKQYYGIIYKDQGYVINNSYYTELEKKRVAKVVFDFLYLNSIADTKVDDEGMVNGNQIAYSALCKRNMRSLCIGEARAINYCLWRWGISCFIMTGMIGSYQHAWNVVTYKPGMMFSPELEDPSIWQALDLTQGRYKGWQYFNIPFSDFKDGRVIDHMFVQTYPVNDFTCTDNIYTGDKFYEGF